MTDRPIDPNDITPEMVEQVEDLLKRQEWNCDEHRDVIAAVLTCSRRWNLGTAEERVTLGDVMRYIDHLHKNDPQFKFCITVGGGRLYVWRIGQGGDMHKVSSPAAFAADVAAWKEGRR